MDHLAILNKKKQWLNKILSCKKTIESRWYKYQRTPWNNIKADDIIYFKNSGEPVTAKAEVEKVLFFDHPNEQEIKALLKNYAKQICISKAYKTEYAKYNYITLVFLKNPRVIKPFHINKQGFGNMAAWIKLENIEKIKRLV